MESKLCRQEISSWMLGCRRFVWRAKVQVEASDVGNATH